MSNGGRQASVQFISPAEIRAIVDAALGDFSSRDLELLHLNASEMSLAHRVAIYIENRLAGWHVDCEYNRNLRLPKTRGPHKKKILPDIIVHRRNSTKNLLGIEFKKSTHSKSHKDEAAERAKELAGLWTNDMPQYCHAAVLTFPVRPKELALPEKRVVQCQWFHRLGCGTIGLRKPKPTELHETIRI